MQFLFEVDKDILPALEGNMDRLVRMFIKKGGKFSYEILNEDFYFCRGRVNMNVVFISQ